MADEIPTMAIPVMIQEAKETGLLNDAVEALELQAKEKIEYLRRLHSEKKLSRELMEAGIERIQREIQEKITELEGDKDILI